MTAASPAGPIPPRHPGPLGSRHPAGHPRPTGLPCSLPWLLGVGSAIRPPCRWGQDSARGQSGARGWQAGLVPSDFQVKRAAGDPCSQCRAAAPLARWRDSAVPARGVLPRPTCRGRTAARAGHLLPGSGLLMQPAAGYAEPRLPARGCQRASLPGAGQRPWGTCAHQADRLECLGHLGNVAGRRAAEWVWGAPRVPPHTAEGWASGWDPPEVSRLRPSDAPASSPQPRSPKVKGSWGLW